MPDAILPISLAASGALVIVLCSLGGSFLRRRPKQRAAGASAELQLTLERTLDQLAVEDDVVEIVDPHPRFARAMSCAETEEHRNSFLPRLMEMRSLIHPGVVTSLVMPDAPRRRLRSAKGTPAPTRTEFDDQPPTVEEPLLKRLAPVPYRGRRARPVH